MSGIQTSPVFLGEPPATSIEKRHAYLQGLLAQKPAENTLLKDIRDRALALLQEQDLPNTKFEDWRFTDLSPLYKIQPKTLSAATVSDEQFKQVSWDGVEQRVVFINGRFAPEVSTVDSLPTGVSFQSLEDISAEHLQQVGQYPGASEVFTA
ncbi:MAG: hypothetical protein AAGB01_05810, partial [Cyanobacteria bacterium P01_F01_bin.42]